MATQGGPAKAVSVQTGGQRQGGAAIPIAVVSDGRAVEGGPAQPIYVVTSGPVQGGPALPVVAAAAGARVAGGPAVPAYVVSGSLNPTPPAQSSLLTSLVAYWALEEASGSRIDATGRGNDLAPNSAPGNAVGKIGNALLIATNSVSIADNIDLSMGDIDFTIALWAFVTGAGTQGMVTKWNTTGNQRGWWVGTFTNAFELFVSSNGSLSPGVAWSSTYSLSTWYLVVAWHDSVANTINIQVNNGTPVSVSHTLGVLDNTAGTFLGKAESGDQFAGRIDEVGVWKRVLTAAERTTLYNGGNGITYPFVGT